jgi:hypothetical protein
MPEGDNGQGVGEGPTKEQLLAALQQREELAQSQQAQLAAMSDKLSVLDAMQEKILRLEAMSQNERAHGYVKTEEKISPLIAQSNPAHGQFTASVPLINETQYVSVAPPLCEVPVATQQSQPSAASEQVAPVTAAQRAMAKPNKFKNNDIIANLHGWIESLKAYMYVLNVAPTDRYFFAKSFLCDETLADLQMLEAGHGGFFTFEWLCDELTKLYFPIDVRSEVIALMRNCKQYAKESTSRYIARFQVLVNRYPPSDEKYARCAENFYFGLVEGARVFIQHREFAAGRKLSFAEMRAAAQAYGTTTVATVHHEHSGGARRGSAMSGVEYNSINGDTHQKKRRVPRCWKCRGLGAHADGCTSRFVFPPNGSVNHVQVEIQASEGRPEVDEEENNE